MEDDLSPLRGTARMSKAGNKMMMAMRMTKGLHGGSRKIDFAQAQETPWRIDDPDSDAWSLSENGNLIHHFRKAPDLALLDMQLTEGTRSFSFRVSPRLTYLGSPRPAVLRSAPPPLHVTVPLAPTRFRLVP